MNKGEDQMKSMLSERDLLVLQMVADGLQDKEIADKLGLSVRGAKWVVHERLAVKVGMRGQNRAAIVTFAFRNGLVQ